MNLRMIHAFIRSFSHFSLVHSFTRSLVHSFIRSLVHPFFRSFIHSFFHSLVHSFFRLFVHSFIHPFVQSFIPSTVHLLYQSCIRLFIFFALTSTWLSVCIYVSICLSCLSDTGLSDYIRTLILSFYLIRLSIFLSIQGQPVPDSQSVGTIEERMGDELGLVSPISRSLPAPVFQRSAPLTESLEYGNVEVATQTKKLQSFRIRSSSNLIPSETGF